ncbi:MAG: response regulator transcription factor [Verrucomicrobiales bacterium]|nr:response regulator transcription factor [Verrucomicrobiales bacterium]MCP5527146.1 response regulator transcription factor [Verrucomicrobiales bacterium]
MDLTAGWPDAVSTMREAQAQRQRTKYLLVDDHAGFRRLVREFLPGPAIEVIECGDGAAALAAYELHRPDWVIMDVAMPVMDGLQATRALRHRFPEARIVVLTQHAGPEMHTQALASGARASVSKADLSRLDAFLTAQASTPDFPQAGAPPG